MKRSILCLYLVAQCIASFAQNPIVPPGIYIADPSAHVWKDGKIYIYGSRDETSKYYCSTSYRVLSSSDLKTWKLSDVSFASAGPGDQVPYADVPLFAPDAQYFNGKYYLYYCMPWKDAEGIASSDSPVGPFINGMPMDLKGINGIDPCVFIDDDGQGYYVWGQFSAKMAKIKPNMKEIDTSTIKEGVVTQEKHYFHEGSYMIKHDGLYYLIYADISRAGAPTCLGYSTSNSPMGPYTYRGVIIDNDHCDPAVWNNHGSLVEFKGKWYVFYHRATNGSVSMRKACLEPITFRVDGSIPEVEMTTQGASGPLDAFTEIDAARACLLSGHVRIKTVSPDNEALGETRIGDKAAFKYIDFKEGADTVFIRVSPGSKPSRISLNLDYQWDSSIGSVDIPAKQSDEWITVKAPIKLTKGVHALWLGFSDYSPNRYGFSLATDEDKLIDLCTVDAFRFK